MAAVPQWYEAFAYFQPILRLEAGQVYVTAEGLMCLAQYFEVRHSTSAPASQHPAAAASPLGPEEVSSSLLLPAQLLEVKKTYSLHPDVVESLERVSFWRRVGKSTLVNLAIQKLLATYPESQIPYLRLNSDSGIFSYSL
ncbi:hypothetical protein [Hymenobacter sp. BRD67]|uniref:hypothetical protein n=1 Tax=Hymenobacter sp. BRD67 TaxID=2675877 RepID=UPI001564EED4|nr:hypothetical protein [Hymenobacter sp. BRD67]QKG51836.1 hypothetical protein GKZ67_03475 [Hymenobacter sp. BRD67]